MRDGSTEDEAPRPKTQLTRPSLDILGVAELEAYVLELRNEIARVEQEMARKRDHRAAANNVFKQP